VGDFQNSAPFRPTQYPEVATYEHEDEDEDEEEKSAPQQLPHFSGNFRPSGQPGVLHYQKQQPGKKDQPSLNKIELKSSLEDINEERII